MQAKTEVTLTCVQFDFGTFIAELTIEHQGSKH
jgi:hypothetical protein